MTRGRPDHPARLKFWAVFLVFCLSFPSFGQEPLSACVAETLQERSIINELTLKTDCCQFEAGSDALRLELFPLYEKTYRNLGLKMTGPDDFQEFSGYLVAREPHSHAVIAFTAFKRTTFGLKVGISAQDGSASGKSIIKTLLEARKNVDGIYSETSGRVATFLFENGEPAPVVSFEDAQVVLKPKIITRPTPQQLADAIATRIIPRSPQAMKNAYIRNIVIEGTPKTTIEVMVGHPLIQKEQNSSFQKSH